LRHASQLLLRTIRSQMEPGMRSSH
jgi:hypothetical protein